LKNAVTYGIVARDAHFNQQSNSLQSVYVPFNNITWQT